VLIHGDITMQVGRRDSSREVNGQALHKFLALFVEKGRSLPCEPTGSAVDDRRETISLIAAPRWKERQFTAPTQLAADRTVFAAERTYAAWVGTGLLAMADFSHLWHLPRL
jgi:hypothetical protein